MVINLKKK